jgi:hypothetical protein
MRLLTYCITEIDPEIKVARRGVQGTPIESLCECGLQCFVSPYDETPVAAKQSLRKMALEFSGVLKDIFRRVAIVPFRFPTTLCDATEISSFLREHATEYTEALARLRVQVQMEVQVRCDAPPELSSGAKQSGTDYLRTRQAQHRRAVSVTEMVRRAGAPWIEGWRERDDRNGIRCFALVGRTSIKQFTQQIAEVEVPPDWMARVSGPWPATEFLTKEK